MLLAEGAGEIGSGNLEYSINIKRNDELGYLASAINEMAAKLKETYTSIKNLEKEITERKVIEEFARQSEHRYRILFDEAPVMYVITRNKEGFPIIEDCNALFLSVLGYTYDEVRKRPLADFYTPESRTELIERGGYRRAISGTFGEAERELIKRDGCVIKVLLRAVPETDKDGKITGTRAMFVDITDRKRVEEQLNEKLDELRRWNEAVMGREMRILDLKREVNELLVKAGQSARYKSVEENKCNPE